MAFWLFKSEPGSWSWEDQKAKGKAGQEWDGVRNYQARNNMREMKVGDRGFFYHSVDEKRIVGIVEVCKTVHPDSTTDDERWECVDIRAVCDVPQTVTLADVKAEPKLAEMALVANTRLSVQPVTDSEWAIVCRMGGLDPKKI
ncbi:MAG TPA: EVE domain-containing protein [Afifellaceae bacterium]|nr:EVE domain-containing protein [Afifellaceae bacterium]